ncbi:MAG: hypothetical protein HGA76_00050 [Candidatus Firestonebacteria bacterium]|nr:hypothetical protein [Candidatus Firestonebacteria bacterium]
MKRKQVYGFLLLGWLLPSWALGSTAVLVKDREHRLWFEKVGKIENLLDNPARLMGVKQYVCDTFADAVYADAQPPDVVFEKSSWDDQGHLAAQIVAPVMTGLTLNGGYGYAQSLQGNKSTSRLDGTYISDDVKSFGSLVNVGAATNLLPFFDLGYAGVWETKNEASDYASDLATPFAVSREFRSQRHALGMVSEELEVFGEFEHSQRQGAYDQNPELDMMFNTVSLHVRTLLAGELGQANWIAQADGSSTQLTQNLFLLAREQYPLDFSNQDVSLESYVYLPWGTTDFGAGVEVAFFNRTFFNQDEYAWQDYREIQVYLPLGFGVELVKGLRIWAQTNLKWQQSARDAVSAFACQPAWGMQFAWTWLEVTLYSFPEATWQQDTRQGKTLQVQTGLEACARF